MGLRERDFENIGIYYLVKLQLKQPGPQSDEYT